MSSSKSHSASCVPYIPCSVVDQEMNFQLKVPSFPKNISDAQKDDMNDDHGIQGLQSVDKYVPDIIRQGAVDCLGYWTYRCI